MLKLLFIPLPFLLAVSEVPAMDGMPAWFQVSIQLGSFGVACALVYWLVRYHIPSQNRTYKESLTALIVEAKEQREQDGASRKADRELFAGEMQRNRHTFAEQIGIAQQQLRDKDAKIIEILREQAHKQD